MEDGEDLPDLDELPKLEPEPKKTKSEAAPSAGPKTSQAAPSKKREGAPSEGAPSEGAPSSSEGAPTPAGIRVVDVEVRGDTKQVRWPVGEHAEAKLGIQEFGFFVCAAHRLPKQLFQATRSRMLWTDDEGQARALRSTEALRQALRERSELRVTVDLVLPKQSSPTLLDASMPRRQTQLRQKLADRHPKVREKAKSAAVQLNQWSLMDPKRDNWKSWKAIVERVIEKAPGLTQRAGVKHVVPPRSKHAGQNAYVIMPSKHDIFLYSFTAEGRRFAYVSEPSDGLDDRLGEILGDISVATHPGIPAIRHGVKMALGSQTVVAQDMTILLAAAPDCLMAIRELMDKDFAQLQEYLAAAMTDLRRDFASKWISVCALSVSDFVKPGEDAEDRKAREVEQRLLEQVKAEEKEREREKAKEKEKASPKSPNKSSKKKSGRKKAQASKDGGAAETQPITPERNVASETDESDAASPEPDESPRETGGGEEAEQEPEPEPEAGDASKSFGLGSVHSPPGARQATQGGKDIDPEMLALAMEFEDATDDEDNQAGQWMVVSKKGEKKPARGAPLHDSKADGKQGKKGRGRRGSGAGGGSGNGKTGRRRSEKSDETLRRKQTLRVPKQEVQEFLRGPKTTPEDKVVEQPDIVLRVTMEQSADEDDGGEGTILFGSPTQNPSGDKPAGKSSKPQVSTAGINSGVVAEPASPDRNNPSPPAIFMSPVSIGGRPDSPNAMPDFPPLSGPMPPEALRQQQLAMITRQVEYYFSPDNLQRDAYLLSKMDEMASVSVQLIAGFNRIKQHAGNAPHETVVEMVREACTASQLLQVLDVMAGTPPVRTDQRVRCVIDTRPTSPEAPVSSASSASSSSSWAPPWARQIPSTGNPPTQSVAHGGVPIGPWLPGPPDVSAAPMMAANPAAASAGAPEEAQEPPQEGWALSNQWGSRGNASQRFFSQPPPEGVSASLLRLVLPYLP